MIRQLVITVFLLFFGSYLFAQDEKPKMVTTIGIFDTLETKSGFRINEYYVELTTRQLDSLKGKKVLVTGELLIIKGIDPNAEEMVQGSLNDRFFIIQPKFSIVYDSREPLIKDTNSH